MENIMALGARTAKEFSGHHDSFCKVSTNTTFKETEDKSSKSKLMIRLSFKKEHNNSIVT